MPIAIGQGHFPADPIELSIIQPFTSGSVIETQVTAATDLKSSSAVLLSLIAEGCDTAKLMSVERNQQH